MERFTSPTPKPQILNNIVKLWETESKNFTENPGNLYQRGRYAMMLDVLKTVKIYEKGGNE